MCVSVPLRATPLVHIRMSEWVIGGGCGDIHLRVVLMLRTRLCVDSGTGAGDSSGGGLPALSPDMVSRSFCFRRTIEGLDVADSAARLYIDKDASGGVDAEAQVSKGAFLSWTLPHAVTLVLTFVAR